MDPRWFEAAVWVVCGVGCVVLQRWLLRWMMAWCVRRYRRKWWKTCAEQRVVADGEAAGVWGHWREVWRGEVQGSSGSSEREGRSRGRERA